MQGGGVQSLVQENPMCLEATKSLQPNYWARALEPVSHDYWASVQQRLKFMCPRACALQQEKPHNKKSPPRNEE